MQTPQLGLMSLFGAGTTPAASGLEANDGAFTENFSSMFTAMRDEQAAQLPLQSLPLTLQKVALGQPLTNEAALDIAQLEESTELTPEQLSLIGNLFAQMKIGELQHIEVKAEPVELLEQDQDDKLLLTAVAPIMANVDETVENSVDLAKAAAPAAATVNSRNATQALDASPLTTDPSLEAELGDELDTEQLTAHLVNNSRTQEATAAGATAATSAVDATNLAASANSTESVVQVASIQGQQESVKLATTATATVSAASAAEQEIQRQQQAQAQRLEFGSDTRQWGGALSGRIVTMIADDIQQARIHLDPPELGSLEVKIQIQHQQAVVHIQAQHAQVRDVLEAQAQRLRDSLAEQGVELKEFDVGHQGQQHAQDEQAQQGQAQVAATGSNRAEESGWIDLEETDTTTTIPTQSMNLLDTYA